MEPNTAKKMGYIQCWAEAMLINVIPFQRHQDHPDSFIYADHVVPAIAAPSPSRSTMSSTPKLVPYGLETAKIRAVRIHSASSNHLHELLVKFQVNRDEAYSDAAGDKP